MAGAAENSDLQQLDTNVKTAQATSTERQEAFDDVKAKLPEGVEREGNQAELKARQTERETAQKALQDIELKLLQDEEGRRMHEKAMQKLNDMETVYNQWKFLNETFGSTASTDRFGQIAQGYTFSELLYHANANRLTSLQRHFTLINDVTEPLELNVIDHFRFDKVRTSRNLSGGESFEVSLALALGLADMSALSQNASLGNVLLDEGFGTLDDKSLDSALDLLTQLKGDSKKLVGIISHVEKLGERITAKIEVSNQDGMGSLSGAGVRLLSDVQKRWAEDHPQEAAKLEKALKKQEQEEKRAQMRERKTRLKVEKELAKEEKRI